MSDSKLSPTEQLINVMDLLSDPILTMSDEEIIAECIADSEDPEQIAQEVRALLLDAVRRYKEQIDSQPAATSGPVEGEGKSE